MVSRETIAKAIVERVLVLKKITIRSGSKQQSEREIVENVVNQILDKIDEINSQNEFATMMWDKPMSEVIIANEWKDFILPSAVRLDPTDLKTTNLLVRSEVERNGSISDYFDWINLQTKFRSFFKKDLSDGVTNLSTLRVNKSFFDIIPIISVGDDETESSEDNFVGPNTVRSIDEPFIPVKLMPEVRVFFRDDYFNTNVNWILQDYFSKFTV